MVLENALEGEMSDHLGYPCGDPAGRNGGNSRNGRRAKTVLTEIGPVELEVPKDRQSTFEPKIVAKRQRRLTGIEDLVSLAVRQRTDHRRSSRTPGERSTAPKYPAKPSGTITDAVLEGMAEWQNHPLDPIYPVIFVDAIHVKIRDGQVANRPIYVALAVTVDGERDILGLWPGTVEKAPSTGCTC
jgi:putative transposase